MKKAKFGLSFVIFTILFCTSFTMFVYAKNMSDNDFRHISSMVSKNWSDDYIGYMSLTVGSDILETDGEEVKLDAAPVIKDGTVMLPIRAVVEESGGTISYDSGIVTIEDSGTTIEISTRSSLYTKNNKNKTNSQLTPEQQQSTTHWR